MRKGNKKSGEQKNIKEIKDRFYHRHRRRRNSVALGIERARGPLVLLFFVTVFSRRGVTPLDKHARPRYAHTRSGAH